MVEVRSLDIHPNLRSGRSVIYSKLAKEFPNHPLVRDVSEKAGLFDEAAAKFSIPSLPTVAV